MSECKHSRFEDWWMDYCPDCGRAFGDVENEKRIADLQARIEELEKAAGIVVRHLQWHEDGSHYVNVDVDNMRALSALLEGE